VTFYVHEAIETGADATARIVAGPGGNLSALQLGALVVVDNVITATADPASKALGKFQGLYILDGGQKYRAEVTVIIDQPGDLIECTYKILGQRPSFTPPAIGSWSERVAQQSKSIGGIITFGFSEH
jgi:hypothetical protein